MSIAPLAGTELPTGAHKQRDSFGLVLTYQNLQLFFDAATSYQINTEADNFKFDNKYRLDGVAKYRLFPRELSSGVSGFFYVVLESNLIIQGKNEINGMDDANSGGTTWYVDPGLQYITRKFVFEGAIQLPEAQHLNGNALENDFITTLSIRMNI